MQRTLTPTLLMALLIGVAGSLNAQQQETPSAPQPSSTAASPQKQPDCGANAKNSADNRSAKNPPCPPPEKSAPSSTPIPPAASDKASDNAFPEQQSEKAADAANGQQQNNSSGHSPAQDNPFPEDQSRKAAEKAGQPSGAPDDPNSSSSSDDVKRLEDPNALADYGNTANIHDPKRAAEDLRVGNFYMGSGNYQGAYNRFKEATIIAPESADAVFQLAEAARSLGKTQEAQQNYELYLAALPKGPKAKDAKKALTQMQKGK